MRSSPYDNDGGQAWKKLAGVSEADDRDIPTIRVGPVVEDAGDWDIPRVVPVV
jgi:hypothetical protein